jgi:flagellin-like hook-associated protein FlgL
MLGSLTTFFQTLSSNSYENRLDIVDIEFRLRDQARGVNTCSAKPSDLTTASFRSTTEGSLRQGIRNITAAVSMITTADQALMEVAGNLTSMRALAVAAADTGLTALENKILDYEFSALIKDIQTKATETSWGGVEICSMDL